MSTILGTRRVWLGLIRASALLLSTFLLVASLNVNESDYEKQDATTTTNDETRASRAAFGSPMEEKPAWLIPLFQTKMGEGDGRGRDGLMVGIAIRLDDFQFLAHTFSAYTMTQSVKDKKYSSDDPALMGFEHGVEFDGSKSTTKWNDYILDHIVTLGHNIAVFHAAPRDGRFHVGSTKQNIPMPEKPPLVEKGAKAEWRGCSVLAWGSWNNSNTDFDFSLRKIAIRDFDYELRPTKCKDGLCKMNLIQDENTGGKLCGSLRALGAPIVCPNKKIEYIVSSYDTRNTPPNHCTYVFKALELSAYIELLEKELA